jgi:hypothetical protein
MAMARHRAIEAEPSGVFGICVTWGLAVIVAAGFAVAWIALPIVGAVVMGAAGGSLAMVLR